MNKCFEPIYLQNFWCISEFGIFFFKSLREGKEIMVRHFGWIKLILNAICTLLEEITAITWGGRALLYGLQLLLNSVSLTSLLRERFVLFFFFFWLCGFFSFLNIDLVKSWKVPWANGAMDPPEWHISRVVVFSKVDMNELGIIILESDIDNCLVKTR